MTVVNKKELINSIAEKEDVPKSLVTDILNDTICEIKTALIEGKGVKLAGLGTFSTTEVQKRARRNKKTGELITPRPYRETTFDNAIAEIDVEFESVRGATFF